MDTHKHAVERASVSLAPPPAVPGPVPFPGPYAAVRETHIGVVVLLGDRAYKVKKPVKTGFLDYSSRAARLDACHREVELNRRLAPDAYLGVADVLDPDGLPCDHLVVMRRMPDDRRLETLVRSAVGGRPPDGVTVLDQLRTLARLMAAFHARADRSPEIDAEGTRDALLERWTDSFEQVAALPANPLDPVVLAEIETLTRTFLAGRRDLFDQRVRAGHIVDGHGDLLADDVFCLDDGPRVLDCLEFDDRLRALDGLDDVAFLAMDLERLDADELAHRFLGWYLEFAADPAPAALLHHYLAYRAFVRTKVACLRHEQGDSHAADLARRLAGLTLSHLRAGQVRLIVVGGLPGSGKSTLAGALAGRLGATVLSSDRIRKELAGLSPQDRVPDGFEEGIYTPDMTRWTYGELLGRAEKLLALGETVVLDASWTQRRYRAAAADIAAETASEPTFLRCEVPDEVRAARLAARTGGVSDADERVARALAERADPWPDAVAVDTGAGAEAALRAALAVITPYGLHETPPPRRRPAMSPG